MAAAFAAWINGRYVPLADACLSLSDAGVTTGAAVSERLRTFRHEPFLLEEHVERLVASAEAAFLPLRLPAEDMRNLIRDVGARNAAAIPAEDDLAISVLATAGTADGPTLCVSAAPIAAVQYADRFDSGVKLVTPATRAMPAETISPQIKSRNRLHWHVADAEAARSEPDASALLLNGDGMVTETATGNLFVSYHGGRRIATPRRTRTLCGISQAFVLKLLAQVAEEADLRLENVLAAEEAFLTSSVFCMLPVVKINGTMIGDGRPGPVYRRVLAAWSEAVGVDIAAQMRRMATASPAS